MTDLEAFLQKKSFFGISSNSHNQNKFQTFRNFYKLFVRLKPKAIYIPPQESRLTHNYIIIDCIQKYPKAISVSDILYLIDILKISILQIGNRFICWNK
jgi:hypothetical protein